MTPPRDRLPAARQRILALIDEMRARVGRLDLVHRQLPVSLYRTRVQCGKPSCHCAEGPGHSVWALGYRDSAGPHTRSVSVEQVRLWEARVRAYRRFRSERAILAHLGTKVLKLLDDMQKLLLDRYRLPPSRRSRS